MSFGNFHFIRPTWLLLLPIAALVWHWVRAAEDPLRGWRAVMDAEFLSAMTVGRERGGKWRGCVSLAAWLAAIVAVAGPTWKPEPSPFADDPVPVMMLLKANDSMNLSDLAPSRMERARLKVVDFANQRQGQPLGLAAYAGSAHLVLPPTRDTSIVASMATEISPEILPKPGDDLEAALSMAASLLAETGGSIVIVADTASPVPDAVAARFKATGLSIHWLAIARDETPELNAINDSAQQLGGRVTLLTADLSDVESIAKATAKAPVAVQSAGQGTRWAEAGWWLVPILAIFALSNFQRREQPGNHDT